MSLAKRPSVAAHARLVLDAHLVYEVVGDHPGIASKRVIAERTGLCVYRVGTVIRRREEVGFSWPLVYGRARAVSGPNAGAEVTGWFPMTCEGYYDVIVQMDDHLARIEEGIRRGVALRAAFRAEL